MVKTCCVKNCDIAPKGNVTCFRFPNNRFLKRKWIDAIGLSNKLTANSTVCIKHFQEDDYDIVRGRPRLKAKVIPSLFCESNKTSFSTCITEEDVISNEINTDVTLRNIKTDSLHSESNLQDKTGTELHNDGPVDVKIDCSTELGTEEKTELQSECSTEVQNEVDTNLNVENGTILHEEGKLEVQVESRTEIQNIAEEDEQSDCRGESLDEKVQNEGSMKSQNEDSSTQDKNDYAEEVQKSKSKPNGVILKEKKSEKGYQESFIESTIKPSNVEDLNKDIEDIIVNYQIKQTRPLPADRGTPPPDRAAPDVPDVTEVTDVPDDVPDDVPESDPVFIEVAVQGDRAGSPRDCLMVLESVQVELDPSTFLADGEPDDCHETVDLADDDDDVNDQSKRPDPISLLTSSDEDEVIIQEPHIDTVEVSDETDEDDVPLVKLLDKPKKKRKPNISIWNAYEYFCMDCQYTATSRQEYRAHAAEHSTILQVCEICDYTTASKRQFARHKRKHKDDRKFKCHLCDYKARHNMSLIYHLKSHRALSSARNGYKCDKCGFKSDVKAVVLKHAKLCASDAQKYRCDRCVYETKRPSDLRRHKARRHNDEPEDDDEFVP